MGFYTDKHTALCRSIGETAPLLCFNISVADYLFIYRCLSSSTSTINKHVSVTNIHTD